MNLPSISVKRPILTFVVYIIIFILGIISLRNLPLEMLPDLTFPALSIITKYKGAGPIEVENTVTKLLESAIATVPNIKNISSTSSEESSIVTVEFEWGTDIDNAANDIRDAIDLIKDRLPSDASKPIIFKFSTSFMPVMMLGIKAKESYPKLVDILEDKLVDPLKQVDGVGNVTLNGGLIREIRVELDQVKINSYKISINRIINIVMANNLTIPAGLVQVGNRRFILRLPGDFQNIEEIKRLVIGSSPQGGKIYLKDVANIIDTYKERSMIAKINGENGVMVMIQKQSKANTVKVAEKCKERIEQIKKKLPKDVEIFITFDSSKTTVNSILNLTNSVLWGGVFVIIVVFLLLIDWRASIVIGLSIPFSLIVAFIFLYFFGYTINIMSLASLAIAIGMVVDNSIVVTENIYRHRFTNNLAPQDSAIKGSNEVLTAVVASTLTTVAIFIPIFFIPGLVSLLFKQLGLAVIVTLTASLFVSLSLAPMAASKLFTKKMRTPILLKLEKYSDDFMTKLKNFYNSILEKALSHRRMTVIIGAAIFIFSLILLIFIGKEFFPEEDQGFIRGTVELESGTRFEVTEKYMEKIKKVIENYIPERRVYAIRAGASPRRLGAVSGIEEGENIIFVIVRLVDKDQRERSSKEIAHLITQKIKEFPGVKKIDISTSGSMALFGIGKPISIEIYGYDIEKTTKFAEKIKDILESIKGTRNVTISRKPGDPEIRIKLDRDKIQSYGLTLSGVSDTVKTLFSGTIASVYREEGKEYDINIILNDFYRKSLDNIKNVMIETPTGKLISLANIASFEISRGPKSITRKNRERYLTVDAETYGRSLSKIVADFEKKIKDITIPEGIRYNYAGQIKEQRSTFSVLFQALILGILLIYLIMAGQFESFLDPFVIMFSVPFSIVGVIWALFLTGVTLNVNSFIGMIMLVGVVVNNGIVLVDYTNQLRRIHKKELFEAVKESCNTRLRPILMTTLTTIFGMLPMALSRGEGSETWVPLGVSVIGGLTVSTMITLIIVPTVYVIFEKRIKAKLNR
jgi:HAE1 family hydrophobic/amphiphilic exporter-1